MSAEHTPLIVEPYGPAVHTGTATLNDQPVEVFTEPDELLCSPARKAVCESHLEAGLRSQMMGDFWMAGCDFDKAIDEGAVRVQFSCAGLSRVLKHCRLTLTQYDSEGNELNTGKLRQKLD